MNESFEGKVALVTGAGSGIGLATAKAFAEAGASVALADVHENAVRSAANELVSASHKSIAMFYLDRRKLLIGGAGVAASLAEGRKESVAGVNNATCSGQGLR